MIGRSQSMRAICLASMLATATPAAAGDETETGLLAALGVTAATGKTSLGDGAGALEAGLYTADTFQKAGDIIASLVNARRGDHAVLLLARSESVDLVAPVALSERMKVVEDLINNTCVPPPKLAPGSSGTHEKGLFSATTGEGSKGISATMADLVGAVASDATINPITLTVDDRAIINAVLMNAGTPRATWNAWNSDAPPATAASLSGAYLVPGESAVSTKSSDFYAKYIALRKTVDERRRYCINDAGKAALATADGFITSLNTSEKGPTPLASAIQSDMFSARNPLILRLTVEQTGGTAITRSGLFYTLGYPNAATVSGGLLVSFRLMDPTTGSFLAVGMVRCIVRQSNIKRVADVIEQKPMRVSITQPHPLGDSVCDYKVSW